MRAMNLVAAAVAGHHAAALELFRRCAVGSEALLQRLWQAFHPMPKQESVYAEAGISATVYCNAQFFFNAGLLDLPIPENGSVFAPSHMSHRPRKPSCGN